MKACRREKQGCSATLESRVDFLAGQIQELTRQRDELAVAIDSEREKTRQLEKSLELFTQDGRTLRPESTNCFIDSKELIFDLPGDEAAVRVFS